MAWDGPKPTPIQDLLLTKQYLSALQVIGVGSANLAELSAANEVAMSRLFALRAFAPELFFQVVQGMAIINQREFDRAEGDQIRAPKQLRKSEKKARKEKEAIPPVWHIEIAISSGKSANKYYFSGRREVLLPTEQVVLHALADDDDAFTQYNDPQKRGVDVPILYDQIAAVSQGLREKKANTYAEKSQAVSVVLDSLRQKIAPVKKRKENSRKKGRKLRQFDPIIDHRHVHSDEPGNSPTRYYLSDHIVLSRTTVQQRNNLIREKKEEMQSRHHRIVEGIAKEYPMLTNPQREVDRTAFIANIRAELQGEPMNQSLFAISRYTLALFNEKKVDISPQDKVNAEAIYAVLVENPDLTLEQYVQNVAKAFGAKDGGYGNVGKRKKETPMVIHSAEWLLKNSAVLSDLRERMKEEKREYGEEDFEADLLLISSNMKGVKEDWLAQTARHIVKQFPFTPNDLGDEKSLYSLGLVCKRLQLNHNDIQRLIEQGLFIPATKYPDKSVSVTREQMLVLKTYMQNVRKNGDLRKLDKKLMAALGHVSEYIFAHEDFTKPLLDS